MGSEGHSQLVTESTVLLLPSFRPHLMIGRMTPVMKLSCFRVSGGGAGDGNDRLHGVL